MDPYLSIGSNPDIVEYIWKTLTSKLPKDVVCVILGTPALADPLSGIVLSVGLGTTYAPRIESGSFQEATVAGLRPEHKYWSSLLDATSVFGDGWLFGAFDRREPDWLESSPSYYRSELAPGGGALG
jgi:hypothetical protein